MKKILHLFNKENSVRGASILLVITLTLSNVLGLLRDRFLTKNISTFELDIYFASFRIPDLIFNFLILGAITSAFIPIFSEYVANKKLKDGFKITNSLINLGALSMIIFAILLYFLMPFLMPLVVPSFDSYRMEKSIHIARLLMITPIFFSLSYIIGGVLNSFKRFFAYSLAPLIYNLSIIFGAAVLMPKYGLISVVYAVIAGSFLHFLIQLPSAVKLGYKYSFILDWKDKVIKRIFKLMIPRTIGMGSNQLMLIVYTAIASSLVAGSISAFNLSNNIQTMPIVVFGASFAMAVFPTLTNRIAEKDYQGFAFYLSRSIRSIAFLLIPASIMFILLRAHIVRLILGSGKFSWDDTRMTALTLGFFSVSLLAQGLIPLLARAFYAFQNTRTPMYISIATAVLSIVLGYPLSKFLGVAGLALAFSIGSYFNALVLFIYLKRKYSEIWDTKMLISFLKITLISIAMGLSMWFTLHFVSGYVDMNRFVGILTQTIWAIVVGGIIYIGLSYIFDCDEMKWAITRKINGNKTNKSTE